MKIRPCVVAIALILATSLVQAATWIEVEETGSTVDDAKQKCFNSAIRRVVGELIVSDTEVSGDTISKEFIGGYSAGYVNDYEVQSTYYDGSRVTVHMNVNVASSKIAERMRTNSGHKTSLSGEKLDTKVTTILEQRSRGDHILSNVLGSYPNNAYILNSGATEAVIGMRRQVYIDVPYDIRWSRYWLDAFNESLKTVALDAKSCRDIPAKTSQLALSLSTLKFVNDKICGKEADVSVTYKNSEDWLVRKTNYYFPDLSTLDVVDSELRSPTGRQHVGLVVDLKEADGNIIGTRCARIPTEPLISFARSSQEVDSIHGINPRPQIHGETTIAGTVRIEAEGLNLSRVSRVDMHIERTCN